MTVAEASAVNKLCDELVRRKGLSDDELRDALATLADGANKRLMAGWTGDRVREEWR